MDDGRPLLTFANPGDAHNFRPGISLEIPKRRSPFFSWLDYKWRRATRWFRLRTTVISVDEARGEIRTGLERWSWRRWRWERV